MGGQRRRTHHRGVSIYALLSLPDSAKLEERPLQGKRTIVKNQRLYNNVRSIVTLWPEDGLNETNVLKLACVVLGYVDF